MIVDDRFVHFISTEQTLGPNVCEKIREQLISLIFLSSDFPGYMPSVSSMSKLYQDWRYVKWAILQSIQFSEDNIWNARQYEEIHLEPKCFNEFLLHGAMYTNLKTTGYSDRQIIEEVQSIIIQHINWTEFYQKEIICSIKEPIESFDRLILDSGGRKIREAWLRRRSGENLLRSRLQRLADTNCLALFADTVIQELPLAVQNMPKCEWDALVEWIFTCDAAVKLMLLMMGWEDNNQWFVHVETTLLQTEHVYLNFGMRAENVYTFLKFMELFESYNMNRRPMKSVFALVRDCYKREFSSTHSSMLQSVRDKYRLNYTHCMFCPISNDPGKFKWMRLHEIPTRLHEIPTRTITPEIDHRINGFLFYEIIRVARESKKRKEVMLATSMALHPRLGENAFIRRLGADVFGMIFRML